MKWVAAIMLLLLLGLQGRLWLGDGGVPELWRLDGAVQEQRAEIERLRQRNDSLEAEVKDLKEGTAALEERARSDLGMIKPDEQLIYLAQPEDAGGREGAGPDPAHE